MDTEELVPVDQVLSDMFADKGPVSWAARDYYYQYYATDKIRKVLDREDKFDTAVAIGLYVVMAGLIIVNLL